MVTEKVIVALTCKDIITVKRKYASCDILEAWEGMVAVLF